MPPAPALATALEGAPPATEPYVAPPLREPPCAGAPCISALSKSPAFDIISTACESDRISGARSAVRVELPNSHDMVRAAELTK